MKKAGRPKGSLSLRAGTRSVRKTHANSGSAAIGLNVAGLGLKPGDEVVIEYRTDCIVVRAASIWHLPPETPSEPRNDPDPA